MGYALQGPQPRTQTTPPMDISLTHRLSFKQAKLTVLVAFILGTLLSLIQISLDYASEDASIDREIHSLLEISHNPAARIPTTSTPNWPRNWCTAYCAHRR